MNSQTRPTAWTRQGSLRGLTEDGIFKFYGIPYAAAPIGPRRWKPPDPPPHFEGVREATSFGPASLQTVGAAFAMRTTDQSEDCLFANVWTRTLESAALQPVMLWIHGGGNLGGAGSEDAFDGSRLAAKGVTAVTFNYRLGALGFLAHPNVGANFAVLDYVAVLQWVRENIASFGGNPDNVTIFGESAGAVAVRTLLACPQAVGLFHRAVTQSAGFEPPAFAKTWSYERAEAAAERLFERLGSRDMEHLREVPAEEIKAASHELSGIFPIPGRVHTPANLVWMPVVDGSSVLDSDPPQNLKVPVLLGCLENEARYFIKPNGAYSREVLANMAAALAGPQCEKFMASFDAGTDTPYEALDKLFTAVIWTEPALETVRRFARDGRTFYYYHFSRLSPGAIRSRDLAKHSAEIRYVFGNLTNDGGYDAVDRRMSDAIQDAWISFARGGVPIGPGARVWPRYQTEQPQVAWLEDEVTFRPFPLTPTMQILNSLRA